MRVGKWLVVGGVVVGMGAGIGCWMNAAAGGRTGSVAAGRGSVTAGQAAAEVSAARPDPAVAKYSIAPSREPALTPARQIALLRQRVRYVFVLYQENRSFDSYFGTFPGAEGLFSHPSAQTPGFYQPIVNTDGSQGVVHPFRIGPADFAADTDDVNHSHPILDAKMDVVAGTPQMDHFALAEEQKRTAPGTRPSLRARQYGELTMAYEDGDTIPLLWRYANRFVLFDHVFQEMAGPSTPGNLSILGAQAGQTQWMLHPAEAYQGDGSSGPGVPVQNDANPLWGSPYDGTRQGRQPVNPGDFGAKKKKIQYNLTYATLPLTLAGRSLAGITRRDRDPELDLVDTRQDVATISRTGGAPVSWGWYQEGYNQEGYNQEVNNANDPVDADGLRASYITHHNGPQYFGYIANNPDPAMAGSMHGMEDFYRALERRTLPAGGGVFYVKGAEGNVLGLKAADPDPRVQAKFRGDDDHPGYSDAEISEAQVAEVVNRIADSPYWSQCAIIITWDDSEGDYDHVPPPIRAVGPDGSVMSEGPRVPLILISPYARVRAIDHETGTHSSVVKFVDTLFGLLPLADLPDEQRGRRIGEARGLANQGPDDDGVAGIGDLTSAFDPARLTGAAPPIPAEYARIPERLVRTLPAQSGYGWLEVGVTPVDYQLGIPNQPPADFNPRPDTTPSG